MCLIMNVPVSICISQVLSTIRSGNHCPGIVYQSSVQVSMLQEEKCLICIITEQIYNNHFLNWTNAMEQKENNSLNPTRMYHVKILTGCNF